MSLKNSFLRLTPGNKGGGHKPVCFQRRESQVGSSDTLFQAVELGLCLCREAKETPSGSEPIFILLIYFVFF